MSTHQSTVADYANDAGTKMVVETTFVDLANVCFTNDIFDTYNSLSPSPSNYLITLQSLILG